jgi:hypothetical protein
MAPDPEPRQTRSRVYPLAEGGFDSSLADEDACLVAALRNLMKSIGRMLDRMDKRIDKPANAHGTFLQGSEQMIDSDTPEESGRAVSNKHSGFGRGI